MITLYRLCVLAVCTVLFGVLPSGPQLGVVCGLFGGAVTNLGSPGQKKKWYLPVTVCVHSHSHSSYAK